MTKIDYKNSKNIIYAKYYNRLYDLIHMKPNHSKTLIKELKKELKENLRNLKLEYKKSNE